MKKILFVLIQFLAAAIILLNYFGIIFHENKYLIAVCFLILAAGVIIITIKDKKLIKGYK